MASLSYQKLKHELWFDDEEHGNNGSLVTRIRPRRFHVRRRFRVKIPNLRRFLLRKTKVVRVAWSKVYKRLKESRSHFGDLFAGNYLFMQVTPTPLKCGEGGKGYVIKGRDQFQGLTPVARIV